MFAVDCDLASAGRAIAEPARAAMLLHMMDGQAHAASALATAAQVSRPAASAHLRHLVEAKLITATQVGRRRLHALASPEVAEAIEALAAIAPPLPAESLRQAHTGSRLQRARVCYGHLGGHLAVTLTDHLADAGTIDPPTQGEAGVVHHLIHPVLTALSITELPPGSRPAVRGCLDWTERTPHLAGRLGSALLAAMLDHEWLTRHPRDRTVTITNTGARRLTNAGIPIHPDTSHPTEIRPASRH